VLLRGIRYRAGRSALVALLAAVAVAAAVLAPAYGRAAEQSVLTDRLAAAPAPAAGLTLAAGGTAAAAPAAHQPLAEARRAAGAALAGRPTLAGVLHRPVGGVDTDTLVTVTAAGAGDPGAGGPGAGGPGAGGPGAGGGAGESLAARLAYRDGVCDRLTVTGACPTGPGQALVSARTAAAHRIAPGDRLTVRLAGTSVDLTVVGTYAPVDPAAPYWGRTVYFAHGGFDPATGAPRVDAIFTGAEADVRADPAAVVNLTLTYPLRAGAVRLDDLTALRAELRALAPGALAPTTDLPAILDDVARDRAAIGRAAPVVAVPLLLLAGFVLFLLVAAVTEERAPELGLARLRGFPAGRAARFGLGEVLVLVAAAAPVGVALGLGVVELAARTALADRVHAEPRGPVLAAAAGGVAVAGLAALLAGRSALRRDPLELLRRVPVRGRWRPGVVDGVVAALAAASLVVALGDPTAPLALLAPPLVALVAGVATARLVRAGAARRLRRDGRARSDRPDGHDRSDRPDGRDRSDRPERPDRGGRPDRDDQGDPAGRPGGGGGPGGGAAVPGLLAAAQLARRSGGQRVAVVVTVAVALLSFAALAWDLAAQARRDHATDLLGADRVYTVAAEHPTALVEAVHAADPTGAAMAVVRAGGRYAGEHVALLGVEAPRLAEVVRWRDHDRAALAALAGALRPREPAPLPVADRIEVTAEVLDPGPAPVRLTALVSTPGGPPRPVRLGTLDPDRHRYAAAVPECRGGCRLLGLALGPTAVAGPVTATVRVTSIRSGDGELVARFDEPDAWLAPETVTVTPGAALTVALGPGHTGDAVVEYHEAAPAVPVVLAGPAPADDPAATGFRFPGLTERPEPFTVVGHADRLPRAGERGLLFDLRHAVSRAERSVALSDSDGLRYEVWAGPAAPPDLPQRLAAAGVVVLRSESMSATLDQLRRRAPALGLRLYLLAGAAAVALALGVAALSTRVGAATRRSDLAALRLVGVPAALLRRAARREYTTLLGWPVLVGLAVGATTAVLMLPGVPLVEAGAAGGAPTYRPAVGALPVAVAATVAGLLLVVGSAPRPPRPATPDRPGGGAAP
jgi:hypothetical protein